MLFRARVRFHLDFLHGPLPCNNLCGFPSGAKDQPGSARDTETWFYSWVGKILSRKMAKPQSVFLPEKSHPQRSLAGYCSKVLSESDTTE